MERREATGGFNPAGFSHYALPRWRLVAGPVIIAVIVSAAASLMLPKRYTATASLIVELPAGADPRAAAALSPVYLESLKTYEHFASSDTIFREAVERLGIRAKLRGESVESLKSSVLRISKPASTRVLDISATLDDAVAAQHLAQYIAERTVELNRSLETRSERGLVKDAGANFDAASKRLEDANRAREEFSKAYRVESLAAEIENTGELQLDLQRDLQESRAALPDLEAQEGTGDDSASIKAEISGTRARISSMERQDQILAQKIERDAAILDGLKERREELDAEQRGARSEAEAAKNRLNEVRDSLAYQGERIAVLDPGIVPERPSFPDLPLNLALAFVLSAGGSILWIAFRYGYDRSRGDFLREIERVRTKERAQSVFSLADRS